MPRKGLNEVEYKQKVDSLYNGEIEVVGRYKGLSFPILIKDKYGILKLDCASFLLKNRPTIKAALNKTDYFFNQLKEKYPDIAKKLKPASEYEAMKKEMLFETQFGLVKTTPDALMSGHEPTVRKAVDRKQYMKNQLLFLYENKYDFIINSTDRHNGKCTLICPIHGEVLIDNDYIFSGCGCIECNRNWQKSDTLYIIKLSNDIESFYKLGITYIKNNKPRRYKDYEKMGYKVEQLYLKTFESYEECFDKEFKLKQLIKSNLYQPKIWDSNVATECFDKELLQIVVDNL